MKGRALELINRRNSLATLSGAGLAALVGGVEPAAAKNKCKKKVDQKCKQQRTDCQAVITSLGGNAAQLACCETLAQCDFTPVIPCLNATLAP